MALYKDKRGNIYTNMNRIGKSNEGEVYSLFESPDDVVKIYYDDARTKLREKKISFMIKQSEIPSQTAWPKEIIYEDGNFAGYAMPRVEGFKEINAVYAADFQTWSLSRRAEAACSLCDAVEGIHAAGHVCGDLNPSNVLVDRDGQVTLVGTDSFHIKNTADKNRVFRCERGLPAYLAPELQSKLVGGQTLADVPSPTFTKGTDLFALAVHIFALLTDGYHPFATKASPIDMTHKQLSVADPKPIDGIIEGLSPFFISKDGLEMPDNAPDLSTLPKEIRALFYRAFFDGRNASTKRPSCSEWKAAIKKWQRTPAAAAASPAASTAEQAMPITATKPAAQAKPTTPEPLSKNDYNKLKKANKRMTGRTLYSAIVFVLTCAACLCIFFL